MFFVASPISRYASQKASVTGPAAEAFGDGARPDCDAGCGGAAALISGRRRPQPRVYLVVDGGRGGGPPRRTGTP